MDLGSRTTMLTGLWVYLYWIVFISTSWGYCRGVEHPCTKAGLTPCAFLVSVCIAMKYRWLVSFRMRRLPKPIVNLCRAIAGQGTVRYPFAR